MSEGYVLKSPVWYVRDGDNAPDLGVDALATSGDCFVTLATQVESVNHRLKDGQPELEAITRTLLYLQRHYKLVKKRADYRQ